MNGYKKGKIKMKKNLIYLFILLSLTACAKENKDKPNTKDAKKATITLEGNETTG